jgi:hypothetical protein
MCWQSRVSVCVLLIAAGCSAPKSHVFGTVKYHGKPVAGATIVLMSPDNSTSQGRIRADGSYEIQSVSRGQIQVAIQADRPRPFAAARSNNRGEAIQAHGKSAKGKQDPEEEAKMALFGSPRAIDHGLAGFPAAYGDPNKSGLAFELKDPDQEYSVDLK